MTDFRTIALCLALILCLGLVMSAAADLASMGWGL